MNAAVNELAKLNDKVDEIIGIMRTPENRFMQIIGIAGAIVTAASILSVIDVVRNWLGF